MLLGLRLDLTSATPIWSQIEEGVRLLVARGALEPGRAVPSVRDLAKSLKVNPATVSKAYRRLCDAGVLVVRRGDGTYVADEPPGITRQDREQTLRDGATRLVALAATLGASEADVEAAIEAAWEEIHASRKGGKP